MTINYNIKGNLLLVSGKEVGLITDYNQRTSTITWKKFTLWYRIWSCIRKYFKKLMRSI